MGFVTHFDMAGFQFINYQNKYIFGCGPIHACHCIISFISVLLKHILFEATLMDRKRIIFLRQFRIVKFRSHVRRVLL